LEYRAKNLGLLVERWLLTHSIDAQVKSVRLKTFAGKYSVNIKGSGSNVLVFDEELIDDMFEGGSEAAEAKFNRLLALNLLGEQEAQAS
jgi:hypothetical protein